MLDSLTASYSSARRIIMHNRIMQFGEWLPITRLELLSEFGNRHSVELLDSQGRRWKGVIDALEHEDGSGLSFNVRMTGVPGNWFHIRCLADH